MIPAIVRMGLKYDLSIKTLLGWWISISMQWLTHWGRVTHICVGKPTIIGSDNGLSPERHQAIIWTNAGILLIGPLGTNFSELLIEIQTFSLKKIRLKMSSAKCCSFRLGLNVLKHLLCHMFWINQNASIDVTECYQLVLNKMSKKKNSGHSHDGSI